MCTVSFVYTQGKMIITSNRDEKVIRPAALQPKYYAVQQKSVWYPKDPQGGGTWFAVDTHSTVIVLLNGAIAQHKTKPSYRKSRGLILLELIGNESPIQAWEAIDLEDIEPFTLVLLQHHYLYQLQWDGTFKITTPLDTSQAYIWSSVTLYPPPIQKQREAWFSAFLDTQPEVDAHELFHFHRYTEASNTTNGLVINREERYKTVSITQAVIDQNKITLKYADLIAAHEYAHNFIAI